MILKWQKEKDTYTAEGNAGIISNYKIDCEGEQLFILSVYVIDSFESKERELFEWSFSKLSSAKKVCNLLEVG